MNRFQTKAELIAFLTERLAHVDPSEHTGHYHQLAEDQLIPLVNTALERLGLTSLKAVGWHPNDHWTDGILIKGACGVNGRKRRIPNPVIGDLIDGNGYQDSPTKEQSISEVADQLWFLRSLDRHEIEVPDPQNWASRLDIHGRLQAPAA